MAKVTGTLSKVSVPLVLTPLGASARGNYFPRTLLSPDQSYDISIPDGYYNVETVGRTVDIEMVAIEGDCSPDDIADLMLGSGGATTNGKTPGVILLGATDEIPIGTRSGTVVIRM